MNLYRDLNPEEEKEFRQWARDNFDPQKNEIMGFWHPVVRDECQKIIDEHKDDFIPISMLAIKIICQSPTEAIVLSDQLEEHDIIPDERDGQILWISVEAIMKDDDFGFENPEEVLREVASCIDNTVAEYEFSITPDAIITNHNFNT